MARILVVEDEELISTMLELNLKKSGFDVTCFDRAAPMLEHLEKEDCDVILLDIMLPGDLNGDEALKILREKGHQMPVLMLTARRELDMRVSTLDNGADDYITKPFDMYELLARVRALLRRAGPSDESE